MKSRIAVALALIGGLGFGLNETAMAGGLFGASGNLSAPSSEAYLLGSYSPPGENTPGGFTEWRFGGHFVYTPTRGPLVKYLQAPTNYPDGVNSFNTGWLFEELRIYEFAPETPQQPAWTDWHEEIVTPGWVWGEWHALVGNDTVAFGVGNNSQVLDILFSRPLEPGTELSIEKQLIYTGTEPFNSTITVREYPTVPEPTTLALFGLGLAGLGAARRRKTIN